MTTDDAGGVADEAEDDPASSRDPGAPDPATSYPRGNRLGLRHPRPTVVIVAAVLAVLGGAFVWKAVAVPKEGRICNTAGLDGTPSASTPEAAFRAWFDETFPSGSTTSPASDAPPEPSSVDDFTRDGDSWVYRVGDKGIKVDIGPAYRVIAANDCSWISV